MKITAWRITKALYAEKAFAGLGAWLEGARWNPKGVYMVYTAESISLAALEMLVHLPKEALLYQHYVKIPVSFDAGQAAVLKPSALPPNWNVNPPEETTQQLGAAWIESRESLVLKVPSSVIPEESNYLINPMHPDFKPVDIGPARSFGFDRRLGGGRVKGQGPEGQDSRGRGAKDSSEKTRARTKDERSTSNVQATKSTQQTTNPLKNSRKPKDSINPD